MVSLIPFSMPLIVAAMPTRLVDPENDAEHRQQRPELVRPDFLEPDDDGVGKGHEAALTLSDQFLAGYS